MPSRPRASFTSMASSPASSRSPALTGSPGACASPVPTSCGSWAPTRRTCPSCRSWTATPTPWPSSVRLLACRRPRSAWTISASPALVGTSTATTASTCPPSCGRPADSWETRPPDGPHIRTTFAGPEPGSACYRRVWGFQGLGSAGGLDAAGFLAVYTIVPLYCGLVFSSSACVVATVLSTGCYIALVSMQHAGWLPRPAVAPTGNAGMAAFNLLIVNVVGVLTAVLSEAYRRSRQRQVTLNRELERANDQAQLLNAEIQRAAQLRSEE